ncbi:hypothetical protein [Sphingomonas sp.]|uniref:hypothetical protein n=1 Tax=Sphingomonas sp. TaxID=28214 RepID=UPI003B00CCBB
MTDNNPTPPAAPPRRFHPRTALIALALLGGGVAAGAVVTEVVRPQTTMAPATPVAIRTLSDGIVTVRGRAVELFGNKLVVQDSSGRALVDLGREGEDSGLVRLGETVTAQGRFEHGFIHAAYLVGADGKVHALGPMGRPHGPGGPGRDGPRDGPRDDRGPRDDAPPPPPVAQPASAQSCSAQQPTAQPAAN